MDIITQMLGSSTPDGEAPLSLLGVIIFVCVLCSLSVGWGVLNFVILFKRSSMYEGQQTNFKGMDTVKSIRVAELFQKVVAGSISFLKFNYIICLIAGLVFVLIIMGAIENFQTFNISLAYLLGLANSIALGTVAAIASGLSLSRICSASSQSIYPTYMAGKNIANFLGYLITGFTTLIMFLILFLSQEDHVNEKELARLGSILLGFSFGSSTVAIATKINGVIYSKGVEGAFNLIHEIEGRLKQDDRHPLIICKAIGQNLNKAVANALDYTMYLTVSIAATTAAAANAVQGVDQKGQIIFNPSISNIYLPIMAICFMLFFSVGASVASNFIFTPSSGDEATMAFKRQIYIQLIFMAGFLSLVAYLCLPAQFWVFEHGKELKSPWMAYLIMLIAMLVMFMLMMVAELLINHPRFIYSLIQASKTGSATNIISGLSFGLFCNIFPVVSFAGIGFLAYFWLGSFGVGLISIGLVMLLPNYLGINIFFVNMQNASMMAFYAQASDDMIGNMMAIAENRRVYQPQVHCHLNCLAQTSTFCLFLVYVFQSELALSQISINDPRMFTGLILGSMLAYTFSAVLIRSIHNVAPVICYDIKAQIEETPGIIEGHVEPDYARTNYFYSINTLLQMKFFLPFFFGPTLVLGIACGPQIMFGAIVGIIISGIQLSISSSMSGHIWGSCRAEIFLGKAREGDGEEDVVIKATSDTALAANVGNEIGSQLKDAVGLGLHGYITYVCLVSTVLAKMFVSIHS